MAQKNCGCGQDPCITFGAEMPIYDINWDTDGEIIPEDGEGNELPSTVMVPSDLEEDEIADYLSDKYGWLVLGFVKGSTKHRISQKYVSNEAEDERVVCFICNQTPEESDGEHGPMMSTLGGDACKDCAEEYGYRHPRDMIYLDAETFEAPKTMTKSQAQKKFLAILKPYWLKDLKESRGPKLSRKQYIAERGDDEYYDAYLEDWDWWDHHVKTVQSGAYGPASPSGDTILREALPFSYYDFIENIAGAVPDELEEKYSYENGYDTGNIYYELCIVDGEPDADNFSAADKRKLAALEKRYDKDLISSDVFFATQEAIFSKYDKQVVHRTASSAAKCRHCGPVIKAMNNMNNWDWEYLDDYDDFWNECKREKIPTRELKSLTKIILGKAKPQPKPKATKKTTTRKAKPKAKKTTAKAKPKAKAGRKAPTISATKRKIGTRMRGNDGKMWEVKKSGKSQRWMAGAEGMDSEQDGYTFAYSQGHNDGRKNIGYNQQLSSGPEQKHFRKILSQRAESDAWDNHIHQEEMALEAYEEYLEEVSEQDEPLSFEDWYEQTMAIYDTPEYDEYLEQQENEEETFEAPKTNKGFVWEYYDYGDDPRTKAAQESYGKYAGRFTIGPAVKKAQKDGWKRVSYNSKYGPRIWSRMAKTPQWKPWVKDLTARCKYERHIMSETTDIFNGTARWKKPGDYSPDHMGEDGDWEILTKDNKIMLLYFYADDELSTRLMRKTFTTSTKASAKAKPKATKAKAGRQSPDISATKRKIGTRMRGNDGNMWEVKPAGKSQRWVRGAETNESSLPYPQPTITDIVSYDFKTYITLRYPDTPEYYGYETVVEYNPDSQYQAEEASPAAKPQVLVAPAIAAIVGVLGGLRAAGFKFKRN
jgi:hypothetical protein